MDGNQLEKLQVTVALWQANVIGSYLTDIFPRDTQSKSYNLLFSGSLVSVMILFLPGSLFLFKKPKADEMGVESVPL